MLPLVGRPVDPAGPIRRLQRAISMTVLTTNLVVAIALLVVVDRDGTLATQARWKRRSRSARRRWFAAIMLTVGTLMLLAVLVYAIGQPGAEHDHVGFQSVYLVLAAGVSMRS